MKTREDKVRLIQSRRWYHSIEIEEGLVTPGQLTLPALKRMLGYLDFPERFDGLTVLDIGAWDGFYSFEAERRGAKRVVAFDLDPADHNGFAIAKELLDSRVEYVQGNVYDLSPEVHGTFDIVFFFGVLYHLRYPLLALDRIRTVTNQFTLLETNCMDNCVVLADKNIITLEQIDRRLTDIPLYRFYRYDELNPGDFSNWFSPNRRAIEDGLWTAGFRPEFLAAWGDRIAFRGVRLPSIPEYLLQTYEGHQWVNQADETQSLRVYPHNENEQQVVLVSFTGPQIRTSTIEELQITPQEEIHRLRPQIAELQEQIARLYSQIAPLRSRIEEMRNLLQSIRQTRIYRFLRSLGFWGWVEKAISEFASSDQS